VRIEGADVVGVSFPAFFEIVEQLRRATRGQRHWSEP
jgi:5-enolpyruvylshikimate-3-phosphate synthase